jgi:MFS family permease
VQVAKASESAWDVRYEVRTIILLTVAFGLVGLDRFIINPMSPVLMRDLGLDYRDLGNMAGALATTWAISAIFLGRLSDRIGRRRVLVPTVVAFSLLVGVTGLVTGVTSLLLARAMMGAAEGAFLPASVAATIEASNPTRRGLNFAIQQNGLPLIGLGLGPILATQLLTFLPSWRWVFVLLTVPGLIIAWLLYRVLKDPIATAISPALTPGGAWGGVFQYRNVPLAILIMAGTASALNIVLVMTPSYLTSTAHLSMEQMGFVMSGVGIGAVLGGLLLSGLSDLIGRRTVLVSACTLACAFVLAFMKSDPNNAKALFGWLLLLSACGFSVIYITIGPLTMESVPPEVSATAIGIIGGIGEFCGGGLAPIVAGRVAQRFGLEKVYALAVVALLVAAIATVFVKRTPGATRTPEKSAHDCV